MKLDFFPPHKSTLCEFDPELIQTDAERLQFKSGGNKAGVTAQLLSVHEWQQAFSGIVYVWQALNGILYIADGHQRLSLAKRVKKVNQLPIILQGYLFKEAEGWTVEKMRAFAAAKNIAEGGESTKPLDVARLLRNGGPVEFLEQHISSQRRCYRDGRSLAKLSDDCFKLVLNGFIPEQWGVIVGEKVADFQEQLAVIQTLNIYKPSADKVSDFVDEALAANFVDHRQINLFGETIIPHALMEERIAIYRHCKKELKKLIELLKDSYAMKAQMRACGWEVNVPLHRHSLALQQINRELLRQARLQTSLSADLTRAAQLYDKTGNLKVAAEFFMAALQTFSLPYVPKEISETVAVIVPFKADTIGTNREDALLIISQQNGQSPILPMALPKDNGCAGEQIAFL